MVSDFPQNECSKRAKQKLQVLPRETTARWYCYRGASPDSVGEDFIRS